MNFLPDVILIGQFPLAVSAFTGLLGGLLAYLAAGLSARRAAGDGEAAQDVVINLLLGGIAAAKLLYILLDLPGHIANPAMLILFPYGPLAVPAGVAGGLLLVGWNLRRRPDRLALLDQTAAPLALGLAVTALGWRGPGAWAFAPLLGAAGVAAAALCLRSGRAGPGPAAQAPGPAAQAPGPAAQAPGPGFQAARTIILTALALVLADLARPSATLFAGISWLQLSAALAATAAWLWSRPGARHG